MKKNYVFLLVLMILALFVFPVFAEDNENLEDMPTTVDDSANAAEPEPNMPVIKKESTYFGVVNIWGGYTTLALNNQAISGINGGYALGLDLGFTLIKDLPLALGVRVELIGSSQGTFTGRLGSLPVADYTLGSSLIPLMAGAAYTFDIPDSPVSISADIYAGYSFAKAIIASDTIKSKNSNFNGTSFALDLGTTISYQINEPTTAGLTLGYRFAKAASMKAEQDFDANSVSISKGTSLQDISNKTVTFDFSGFTIGIKVDMKY